MRHTEARLELAIANYKKQRGGCVAAHMAKMEARGAPARARSDARKNAQRERTAEHNRTKKPMTRQQVQQTALTAAGLIIFAVLVNWPF